MSNEEMNAALDGILGDEGPEPVINAEPIVNDPEAIPEEIVEEPIDSPPGYLDHAAYLEKNGNDDGWRGKDAYSAEYERIQDNKSLKQELRGMNDLLRQTVDATTSMQNERYQQGLIDARAELDQAREDDNVDAAIAAQTKISNIEGNKPQAAQPQINPAISQFITSNPALDNQGAQYDPEFRTEFERIYHGRLQADGVRPETQLTERAIQGYMKNALASTKALFPDKFESTRNNRQTSTPAAKRSAKTVAASEANKNLKVTTKNPRDNNAYSDVYEAIKAKDPKAAEAFAEKMRIGQ